MISAAVSSSGQRQTIVNVLCACLRLPWTLPGDAPAADAGEKLITTHRERVQQREGRAAAQRILIHHLRPGSDLANPVKTFWADIDIELAGATLIDFDLLSCHVRTGSFSRAHFNGVTSFSRTKFTRGLLVRGAQFTGDEPPELASFVSPFDEETGDDDGYRVLSPR